MRVRIWAARRTFSDYSGTRACRLLASATEELDAPHLAFKAAAVQSGIEEAPGSAGPVGFLEVYVKRVGNVEILESMSDVSRAQCFRNMTAQAFEDGEVIMNKGSVVDAIYFVQDGKALLVSEGRTLREYRAGNFFGVDCFLASAQKALGMPVDRDEQTREFSVISKRCVCWRLHVHNFAEVISRDLARNQEVLKVLSRASQERLKERRELLYAGDEGSSPSSSDGEGGEEEALCDSPMTPCGKTLQEMEDSVDFGALIELIPGRLAFTVHSDEAQTRKAILHDRDTYYFSSELHEAYEPFCADFGPVDLAIVFEFCALVHDKLSDDRISGRLICYYAEKSIALRTNAAFLMGAYLILAQGFRPAHVMELLEAAGACAFLPFRDATHVSPSTFDLTLLDCFKGLQRGVSEAWFDLSTFDVHRYNKLQNPGWYDMHVICPKFVAFRGPDCRDSKMRRPRDYIDTFWKLGVTAVVRLNGVETYNKAEFEREGIKVYDLQFEDCTAPPARIVERFFEVVDKTKGAVAVHCLAGLGRTGTLISLWIMKNLGWSARECIAWLRIVRPGSVLGSQQHYLEACQRALARKHPLPEPDAVQSAHGAVRAPQVARQVEKGMLRRRNNAAAASGFTPPRAPRRGPQLTDSEKKLIAQLGDTHTL